MALPTKVQVNGRWAVDPGTGDSPLVYCSSTVIADKVVAAILGGGLHELTIDVDFVSLPYPSEVQKVRKL